MAKHPRTQKKKDPTDVNELAYSIVRDLTSEEPEPYSFYLTDEDREEIARKRAAGQLGGKARASKLTAEQRQEIARRAAQARWAKKEKEES